MAFIVRLTLLLVAAGVPPGWACSCVPYRPAKACQLVDSTLVIFRGRVIDHNDPRTGRMDAGPVLYRFRVLEALKRLAADTTEVFLDPLSFTSCATSFQEGVEYLVYAGQSRSASSTLDWIVKHDHEEGRLKKMPSEWTTRSHLPVFTIALCNPTRKISDPERDDDLRYLRGLPSAPSQTEGWIEGRAVQNHAGSFVPGEASAPATEVQWQFTSESTGAKFQAVGKADGSFRLPGVPAGTYAVTANSTVLADAKILGSAKLVVPPRGCAVAYASFETKATVSGTVRHADGSPAGDISIQAGLVTEDGKIKAIPDSHAQSDPAGRFTLTNVPLGRVVVAVNLRGAPSAGMPFDTVYAPATQDRDAARVFEVGRGQHLESVDIRLPKPLPVGELRVKLVWPDGTAAGEIGRAWASWNGKDAGSARESPDNDYMTMRLVLNRTYSVRGTWLNPIPWGAGSIDGAAPQIVDFNSSGQTVEICLKGPSPNAIRQVDPKGTVVATQDCCVRAGIVVREPAAVAWNAPELRALFAYLPLPWIVQNQVMYGLARQSGDSSLAAEVGLDGAGYDHWLTGYQRRLRDDPARNLAEMVITQNAYRMRTLSPDGTVKTVIHAPEESAAWEKQAVKELVYMHVPDLNPGHSVAFLKSDDPERSARSFLEHWPDRAYVSVEARKDNCFGASPYYTLFHPMERDFNCSPEAVIASGPTINCSVQRGTRNVIECSARIGTGD
jgi:hypothetical protein